MLEQYLYPRYLIFELPVIAAMLYILLLVLGVHDGTDQDHDFETDHDINHDHDSEHEGVDYLSFLGVGKVPLSIIITTFLLLWGFSGWATLILLEGITNKGWISFVPALVIAFLASSYGTGKMTSQVSKWVPKLETFGIAQRDLIGKDGITRYPISESFGAVQVYDEHNTLHEVQVRLSEGQASIPQGKEVILSRFDQEKEVFYVLTKDEFDEMIGI